MNISKLHFTYSCMCAWNPDTECKKLNQNCTSCWDKFTRHMKKYTWMDSKRSVKPLRSVFVHALCLFLQTYCVESAMVFICPWTLHFFYLLFFLAVFPSVLLKSDHVICDCLYKTPFKMVMKIFIIHNSVNDHSKIYCIFLLVVCIWGVRCYT